MAIKPLMMSIRMSGTKAELSAMASAVGFAVAVAFDGDAAEFMGFGGEALDGGDAAQVVGQADR